MHLCWMDCTATTMATGNSPAKIMVTTRKGIRRQNLASRWRGFLPRFALADPHHRENHGVGHARCFQLLEGFSRRIERAITSPFRILGGSPLFRMEHGRSLLRCALPLDLTNRAPDAALDDSLL